MFNEIENESFPKRELRILQFWHDESIFEKSLEHRKACPYFTMYDGPPFATGLPHYGHLLAGLLKDVVPRYKTMKGFFVPRRFGWDCHGLPVENEIEKNFQLSGAASIEEFGIGAFNEECRKIVLRYTSDWKKTVDRIGRWVDFSKTWKTMDLPFMESVWWVFKTIYEKGLVYEGYKVMPFSAKLGTPLSNFEAAENYKDVDDPSIVVAFAAEKDPHLFFLAWTTTPWTLVSNMALCVGDEIEYVKVHHAASNRYFILAKGALERYFKPQEYVIVSRHVGKELVGMQYQPVLPYFQQKKDEGAFRVISNDFVSTDDGTGIVHTAPAFGEDDFYAGRKANIPLVCPVDQNGRFTTEIPEYTGQFVKDADKAIIRRLKEEKKLFYQGTINHRYPFCWRSDTPLIYKAVTTWFVAVEKIKEKMVQANNQVHWMPQHLKEGRFGKWLEGARDWAISRNRYWGTPIPIWKGDKGTLQVIGSKRELEELVGVPINDLHRHFIDSLTFEKNGERFTRISEVFDCWFESGSMPYGQNHYPFENKKFTEKTFPADFIAEGLDQTRGWFYTLMILSTALFNKPAFKNVVTNGIVLAEDGSKMSKRLRNYPDPMEVIDKYGADAVRLYMLNSPAVKADDLRFSEKGVELTLRQVLIPLWNAQSFFITYARINQWVPKQRREHPQALIDQWILSQLNKLISDVEKGMDDYDLSKAVEPFVGFIDHLTNWYIRRSRRRFWEEISTKGHEEAYETLYHVLMQLSKIVAPFIPFIAEALFLNLRTEKMEQSVHVCNFPSYDINERDEELEKGMDAVLLASSLGHSLRKEHKLKVRQPLPALHLVSKDPDVLIFLKSQKQLIAEELNVKEVYFHQEKKEFIKLTAKPNFKVLGKKVGKAMKEVQFLISQLGQAELHQLDSGKSLSCSLVDASFILEPEDVEMGHMVEEGWVAISAGALTVALETELTEELILEGIARELVNKINTMRREAQLAVTDRITVQLASTLKVNEALRIHEDYVKEEVLATAIHPGVGAIGQAWDINGEPAHILILKI